MFPNDSFWQYLHHFAYELVYQYFFAMSFHINLYNPYIQDHYCKNRVSNKTSIIFRMPAWQALHILAINFEFISFQIVESFCHTAYVN